MDNKPETKSSPSQKQIASGPSSSTATGWLSPSPAGEWLACLAAHKQQDLNYCCPRSIPRLASSWQSYWGDRSPHEQTRAKGKSFERTKKEALLDRRASCANNSACILVRLAIHFGPALIAPHGGWRPVPPLLCCFAAPAPLLWRCLV